MQRRYVKDFVCCVQLVESSVTNVMHEAEATSADLKYGSIATKHR